MFLYACQLFGSGGRNIALMALVFWGALALPGGSALADSSRLEEAKRYYEEAEFSKALDVLDRSEFGGSLTRSDLLELMTIRAMIHFALDDERSLHSTLIKIASLSPNFIFPKSAPPALRDKFKEAKKETSGQLQLKVLVSRQTSSVSLHPEIEHDPGKIVRETRLYTRSGGDSWKLSSGVSVELPLGVGVKVDYYAEAIGPGNTVIASEGSRSVPKEIVITPSAASIPGSVPVSPAGHEKEEGGSMTPWIIVGVVTVAAAVGGFFLIRALTSNGNGDNTQISPPTIGAVSFP